MPTPIDSITTRALGLALDAAQLRQQAISANIANHATPDFAPQSVDFDAQLQRARSQLADKGQLTAESLAGVQPRLTPAVEANGQPQKIRLDEQMAQMAENTANFQALTKAVSRHFSILGIAASDGKR